MYYHYLKVKFIKLIKKLIKDLFKNYYKNSNVFDYDIVSITPSFSLSLGNFPRPTDLQ